MTRIELGYSLESIVTKLLRELTEKVKAEKVLAEAKTREINTKNGFA